MHVPYRKLQIYKLGLIADAKIEISLTVSFHVRTKAVLRVGCGFLYLYRLAVQAARLEPTQRHNEE
jgi:hypothetical protein